jgi:hypothetical protein
MKQPPRIRTILLSGAAAGLIGGAVFGAAMLHLEQLSIVGMIVGVDFPIIAFVSQLVVGAVIGVGFSLLLWQQRPGAGETLFWGLTYGLAWWILGPLTLGPLFLGDGLSWNLATAQNNASAFLGYLVFGTTIGLVLAIFQRNAQEVKVRLKGPLIRGALAGSLAAWLLSRMLDAQDQLMPMNNMMPDMLQTQSRGGVALILVSIGLLAGLIYAWLYPIPVDGGGPGLIRGSVYGFLWWVVGAQTIFPLLSGEDLAWTLSAIQSDFATLPGYLFFGAILVYLYLLMHKLVQLLFGDYSANTNRMAAGTQGLYAMGRGILAGSIGGLLFSLVMIQIGFLPNVANLVGANTAATGFMVHFIIAILIGMSYAFLFHRQSFDFGSAIAWGVSYGVFWWMLGPLTLMPIILGSSPQWTADFAVESFAALIGHLAYGAGLGVTVYILEARYRPWWVSHFEAEALRIARHKEQILTSAPALWVLVVVITVTLPILLGM